jgi:primosomal protein N'
MTTGNKAAQIAEKFYKTPGSILIGTEMALYYLKNPINFTAVASVSSLFSTPDFRIREKIFHLILSVKSLARERCMVQTREAEKTVIEMALSGNILDFYKMEIEDRKLLEYPPFSVFIKVVIRGPKAFVEKESQFLEKFFEKWNPVVFNSLSERRDSPAARNCVMKIKRNEWPESELLSKIMSLPPYFEIKVDPDNLL